MSAAFYLVADERYFLGAVGTINSLRLVGHREPIFVCDRGLSAPQRALLEREATLVAAPPSGAPWLQKTIAPLRHPATAMVLVDADVIVTRSLADLIEQAIEGTTAIAFRNNVDRWVDEWGELLGLGSLARRPYVSSGLVVLGGPGGLRVLDRLDALQGVVEVERSFAGADDPDYAFRYPEQDILNAILAAASGDERVVALANALCANPPYAGLRIVDAESLRCSYADGSEPYALHQFVRKPWLEATYHGVYARLLARLLTGDDVALGVEPADVPRTMRAGPVATLERLAVSSYDLGRWTLGERLPAWLRKRLAPRRGRS